jgi:class 3 adenylate cyclase
MAKEVERLMGVRLEKRGLAGVDVMSSIDHVQVEVAQDKPDLSPVAAPDGTVTIMFSDIEDSTVLTDRLGDHRWMELLRYHDDLVRRQLAAHGGFEVKSQGDGFMLAFGSARSAIKCAAAIQRELEAHRASGAETPLRVRIGLHTGEVLRERDDFFGKNVVLAARIAGKATGNEILVSGLLRELVASAQEFEFGAERELELKGLPGTHRVFSVQWDKSPVEMSAV